MPSIQADPPNDVVDLAVAASLRSGCAKSKRGVAIFDSTMPTTSIQRFVVTGANHQPPMFGCSGTAACRRDCGKLCIHAEQHAIISWLLARGRDSVFGAHMVHVKTIDGVLVPSGGPSCWQCSRLLVEYNFGGIYLYEEAKLEKDTGRELVPSAWWFYTTLDFHRRTLRHCGLGDIGAAT